MLACYGPAMPARIGQLVTDVLAILLILSATIAIGRFVAAALVAYETRLGLEVAVTGLTTTLVGVVYVCGALASC